MATFEKFKPQLKPGRIVPQNQKLLFETEDPVDQIVLPLELVDFLLCCTGEYTMAEIIERIYHSKGHIRFKSIYKTLLYLRERGFLVNGDELEVAEKTEHYNEVHFLSFRPFLELNVGKRIFHETDRPQAFYLSAMFVVISAILSFQLVKPSWFSLGFLNLEGSYANGLIFLFVAASALLSLKNLFKCLLLIFLTGRAYNFGFVFNGFAFYFRVRSDSLFLVTNRLYLTLFHLAVTLCYFPIIATIYFFFPNLPYQTEAMSLGFLLFMFDVNPFQESESGHLLRSLFNDDMMSKMSTYMNHRTPLSILDPYAKRSGRTLYFVFAKFALAWSVIALYTVHTSLRFHYQSFFTTMKSAPLDQRLAALVGCSFLITLGVAVMYNAAKIIFTSIVMPFTRTLLDGMRKRRSHRLRHYNDKEVVRELEHLPLFSYFSSELLTMIATRSDLKEYRQGTPVIVQGDDGRNLYVLLGGQLQVRKRLNSGKTKIVSEIHPTTVFGEVAVIEETTRTADVIAITKSLVLEVPARMLRQLAEDSQYIREIDNFRNAIMVNQFFTSAPMFRELSPNITQLFTVKGKIETYLPDQIIFKQGDIGDGFYLILRGSVGVGVNGRPVSRIQQGGFFGEISMIADVPRTATIYAFEATQVLKIGRDAFWEILSLDINMAMFIESVGEMRIREDIEILKAGNARVA